MNASRRLDGLGVVITRPADAAQTLGATLAREGAVPFFFPGLTIEAIELAPHVQATLAELDQCMLAVFVSANAVEKGVAAARRHGPWPARTGVAAVGEATARALRDAGFSDILFPHERHDSEGLLALPQLRAVKGERIVVFRGEGGREHLRDVLESRGAQVDYIECYRRARPRLDPRPLLDAWARGEVHAVSVLSAETLENFLAMIGAEGQARLAQTLLVVPHPAVAAHPDARRFARVLVSTPGAEGVVQALASAKVTP